MRTLRHNTLHWFPACAFIALYLLFDWATYIDPLHGLNITPWNPDPALGMVFWLRYGKRAALPWLAALLAGEVLVRGMSAGLMVTLLGALWLTLAYGVIGEALRRRFSSTDIFDNSHRLFAWIAIVVAGTIVNGALTPRVPNTTNISFDGVEAESLLIALDLEGFAVSTGSACSSGTLEPSHVLRAMGLPSHRAQNSIRFSLGAGNTEAQVDALLATLPVVVEKLRTLVRR